MASEQFKIGQWNIVTKHGHILNSRCEITDTKCPSDQKTCTFCKYAKGLELPSLPEMVFPYNTVALTHDCGIIIQFNALDALKMVDSHKETLTVAAAQEWLATRKEGLDEVKDKVKPFDWTFTTPYRGTIENKHDKMIKVEESTLGIDYNKLKIQEKILFYEDMILYEDELADNGIAQLRIKMRVMASGFFILLRFFLRVDDVLVRINDTRLYHSAGSGHIVREFSIREAKLPDPTLPLELVKDMNKLSEYLPHNNVKIDHLIIPD